MCPRSSDPFYVVTYYINLVTTSRTFIKDKYLVNSLFKSNLYEWLTLLSSTCMNQYYVRIVSTDKYLYIKRGGKPFLKDTYLLHSLFNYISSTYMNVQPV